MNRTAYIFSEGQLSRRDQTLLFQGQNMKHYIPVENTDEIMIFSNVCVNQKLLNFLAKNEICLHYFNYYGFYSGSFYPREQRNSGFIILKQAEHYLNHQKRVELARIFVEGAVRNILFNINYYIKRGVALIEYKNKIMQIQQKLVTITDIPQLMALEGKMRECYYMAFDHILKQTGFSFERRSRRPPENSLNALISFGNTLMYSTVLGEIYQTYLDPRIGYLHSTNTRSFSLNLDVAEIFKPVIIDRIIFTLVNKKIIQSKHFTKEDKAVYLSKKGRELFIAAYDDYLRQTIMNRQLGRPVSYKRLIHLELQKIQKHILSEAVYQPFTPR